MIRINQIKVPIVHTEDTIRAKIEKLIKTKDFNIEKIVKKSIDARDKQELMYIYTIDITTKNENKLLLRYGNNNNIMSTSYHGYKLPFENLPKNEIEKSLRPIIIGAGPAGYFCGLYLARMGFKPIIFERGMNVEERSMTVEAFWRGEQINTECNVSFGEGGAGTFSDGKLNTGIKDKMGRIGAVISDFISFGAPEDIRYLNKPHIGTDELKKVLVNMRQEIMALGGEIYFNSCFIDYKLVEKFKDKTTYNVIIKNMFNMLFRNHYFCRVYIFFKLQLFRF